MLYTKKALQMGAIAVGLAAFAGQSSLAESAKKEDSKPVAKTETMQVMPELTMASHFVGVPYSQSGVSVSVINIPQMEKEGIETLTGALSQTPGVYTLDGGASYQRGSVSNTVIRGMNSDQYTLTMIDGMRISDSNMTGDKVLGITSLFSLGSLEVVKGSQGAVYGTGAVGGVINMDTPVGEGDPTTKIFVETGSFETFNSYVTSQGQIKKLSYFVGVGFETTANDPSFPSRITNAGVKSNDFRQWSEALRLKYDVNDKVAVNFTYRRLDAYLEYPETSYLGSDEVVPVKDKNRSNLFTAKIDAEMSKVWTTSFMAGYYTMNYSDKHLPDTGLSDIVYINRKLQGEWRNKLSWNKHWITTAGFTWNRDDYSQCGFQDRTDLENTYGVFAEQMWQPFDSFNANIALRLEHDTVWDNNFTWRYSNSWKVFGKESKTRILGSIGSGFRAPTYFERYGYYSSYSVTEGNPDLKISRSLGGDLGVEQKLAEDHYVTVTGFWTRINDVILSGQKNAAGNTSWINGAYATSYGLETSFRGRFKDAWKTGYALSYTYTMPKNAAIGEETRQMAKTARHMINADINVSPIESVTTGFGLTAALGRTNWGYMESWYPGHVDRSSHLDDFFTLRWYARWQVNEKVALHLRVENLLNEKYAMTNDAAFGTWQARGIGIFGGVTVEF